MRNRCSLSQVRVNRHMFSCGMFGPCAATMLSPTAPQETVALATIQTPKDETTMESFTRWELPIARDKAAAPSPKLKQRCDCDCGSQATIAGETSLQTPHLGCGGHGALIEGLVEALRESHRPALKPLLALCLAEPQNRGEAVRAGAVEALLDAVPNLKDVAAAERALATLDLLCTVCEGRVALRKHALAVPLLLEMILKVSDRGTEHAVSALCGACEGALDAQETALQCGALTQLLLLLQSECTARAKRKALHLLKLLHKLWEDGQSSCNKNLISSGLNND